MNTVLLGVLIYVALQLLIGLYVSRRIKTEADYLLAGRSLGYMMATFSIFATWFGAESCIGSSGAVYESGLSGGTEDPFGYALCLVFMGTVFAAALWKLRLFTLADLFRKRFGGRVELLAVLMLIPSSVMWAAAQIRAFGQVLSASAELDVVIGITIAATAVLIYTVSGGLLADAITDIIQGTVLILGLFIVFGALVISTGGFEGLLTSIEPGRLNLFGSGDTPLAVHFETWLVPICGSVVAQELVARVCASRSAVVAQRSSIMAGGMYLIIGLIPITIGLAGPALFPNLADAEQILPRAAQHFLPQILYIVFAGALVSAILSTVDSALLGASSLLSHNLIIPRIANISEKHKVKITRIGVVIFGLTAYILAIYADRILDLVIEASSFGTSGIFVIVVFGLFTRFGNANSAIATLVTGVSVWVFGKYVFGIEYPYMLSLISAIIVYIGVALFNRGKQDIKQHL